MDDHNSFTIVTVFQKYIKSKFSPEICLVEKCNNPKCKSPSIKADEEMDALLDVDSFHGISDILTHILSGIFLHDQTFLLIMNTYSLLNSFL